MRGEGREQVRGEGIVRREGRVNIHLIKPLPEM